MQLDKIYISKESYDDTDFYAVLQSNISFINFLWEEAFEGQIHKDALASYYVDFYFSQYENGNFSQFVWNTKWNPTINQYIQYGLEQIRAIEHLELFIKLINKVTNLGAEKLAKYLAGSYFEDPLINELNDDSFFAIDEQQEDFYKYKLNSQWLKQHPDLQVMTVDDLYSQVEKILTESKKS